MSVYVVTGKLGAGKTLCAVGRIRDYLLTDRKVATNLNLNLVNLIGPFNKTAEVYRIPDRPTWRDLEALGNGCDVVDESRYGLLVFDECATWFNSRKWNEPGRAELIDWLLHARKRGWDIIFIIQDKSLMDSQAREAFAEHVVYCRRADRMPIPFIGSLVGVFLPRIHMATVKYGDSDNSLTVERWVYRGVALFSAYDTRQVFKPDSDPLFQYLPPFYVRGRYMATTVIRYQMQKVKRFFIRHWLLVLFLGAALSAPAYAMYFKRSSPSLPEKSPKTATSSSPADLANDLYITGSIQSSDGTVYFFEANSKSYSSDQLNTRGYEVVPVKPCLVFLRSRKDVRAITCAPTSTMPANNERPAPSPLAKLF